MSHFSWKVPILAVLAIIALLSVVACGSDDNTATNAAAQSGASASPPSADSHAGWPKTFRVGIFGGDDAEATLNDNAPLKDYLSKELGIPVDLTTGTSYNAVIEAMRAGHVDAMSVGPFSYLLAVQEANAEAIAVSVSSTAPEGQAVYDPNIPPYYISVIITRKGNGISSIQDLKGKSFSFVDPASTSGHLAPATLLMKNGIDPDKDMHTVYAGSHPTSALAVYNGKTDAGATYEGNLERLAESGQVKWCKYPDGQINKERSAAELKTLYDSCPDGSLVVLGQSDPIPNTPFAVNKKLPQSFKDAVRTALLKLKDNPEYIKAKGSWYVDPTQQLGLKNLDAFYDPLRDIAKLLNLDLKELE